MASGAGGPSEGAERETEREAGWSRLRGVILQGAGLGLGLRVVGVALAFGLQILLARWMGVREYGAYAYAFSWLLVLAVVAGFGMRTLLLRYIPEYEARGDLSRLRGVLRVSHLVVLVAGVAVAAIATALFLGPGGAGLSTPGGRALVLGFWGAPLLALLELQSGIFRTRHRVLWAVAPQEVGRHLLVLVGLVVVAGLMGTPITSAVGMAVTVGAMAAIALVQRVAARRTFPAAVRDAPAILETGEWLRVGLALLLVASFNVVIARTDVIMLGVLMDPETVGLFNAAARTAGLAGFVLLAVNLLAAPTFASLFAKGDRASMQRLADLVAHAAFWPSLLAFVGLWALGPAILSLFGATFPLAQPALVLLAFGHLVSASFGLVGVMLNVTGHQRITATTYGISAVLNIALNWILIPRYGGTGAAVATMTTMIVWNVALYWQVLRKLGVHTSIVMIARRQLAG